MSYDGKDPSILDWLRNHWRYLLSGRWVKDVRTESSDSVREEDLAADEIEQTLPGVVEAGDAVPVISTVEGKPPVSDINLSIKISPGTKLLMEVENLPGDSADVESEIIIRYTDVQGEGETDIEVSPTTDIPVQLVESKTFYQGVSLGDGLISTWDKFKSIQTFKLITLELVLLILVLGIYLVTRFIGLELFPIYFFTDEAVHTVLAESLVQNGFRFGEQFLPTYFPMGSSFGLNSVSVYLQVIPYLLFGKSVFVTRAVSVLITVLGAVAVGLTLKDFLKIRYWWVGILLLSITPAWFLHSRTAFENVLVASFYACFLYFYLRYRLKSPRSLYIAILFAALTFYAHGLGQFLIIVTAVLLFFSDLKYHWKNRKTVLFGIIIIMVLALPYYRFAKGNPAAFENQMRMRASYWIDPALNLGEKIKRFSSEYISAFNPAYWFGGEPLRDLIRHRMKGYGHMLLPSIIFVLWGLILVVRNFKSPAYRTILLALLAAPVGAAMVQISILRTIWMVIPLSILAAIGVNALLVIIERKWIPKRALSLAVFVLLAGVNIYMTRDVLVNGPLWYDDYTLYGMQYGAKQIFGEAVPDYLEQNDQTRVVVTPTWANGTDNFVQFFLSPEDQQRVRLDSIDAYLFEKLQLDENLVHGLTPAEYQLARESNKFKVVDVDQVIDYPNGSPGFYFVRIEYADNVEEIFAAEKAERQRLVEEEISLDGQTVIIRYSLNDMGEPSALFDGDFYTLMRGLEANPYIVELVFPEPRSITGIQADFANMDFTIKAMLYEDESGDAVIYEETYQNVSGDPHVDLVFESGPHWVEKIRLEILSHTHGERAHIHIREINIIP